MKIEFWSDVVCPWCGLMDHRLHRALTRFPHRSHVRVVHRSFQLHPDLPREGVTQRQLFDMFGVPRATGEQTLRSVEKAAAAEGLSPYHGLDRTLGPTDLAHELLAYATDQGRGNEIWSAMFRAHFGQARKLWTAAQVLDFAAEVGLDRDEAAAALERGRYRERVAADQRAAQRLGAHGTPFIVLDGRYAIPGAIGTDDLLCAITTAWQDSHPATVPPLPTVSPPPAAPSLPTVPSLPSMAAETGAVCTPDGCAVPTPNGN